MQWAAARGDLTFVDGAQNQRDACRDAGTLLPVDDGLHTRGALLFRIAEGPGGDHVAISLGNGQTMEARGRAYGVNVFRAGGRRWTHAGMHDSDPGPADGIFGRRTDKAARAFQEARRPRGRRGRRAHHGAGSVHVRVGGPAAPRGL